MARPRRSGIERALVDEAFAAMPDALSRRGKAFALARRVAGELVADRSDPVFRALSRAREASYSARRLGLETTGNAGGPANVVIEPGKLDLDGLLAEMGDGLLVTELMGNDGHNSDCLRLDVFQRNVSQITRCFEISGIWIMVQFYSGVMFRMYAREPWLALSMSTIRLTSKARKFLKYVLQ